MSSINLRIRLHLHLMNKNIWDHSAGTVSLGTVLGWAAGQVHLWHCEAGDLALRFSRQNHTWSFL